MLDKKLLLIGIPTNGEHSHYFTQSLVGIQYPTNFSLELRAVENRPVDEARNILVQTAINLNAKYLMFLDEDVIGPMNGIRTLLFHLENHPNWTVCGGVYSSKTFPPEPLIYTEWGMGVHYGWKKGEMVRVKGTGCGFHLFRVADLANMEKPEFYEVINPWNNEPMKVRRFFYTGDSYVKDEKGNQVHSIHTEDTFFYKMCEEEGLQVWLDTNILCQHYDKTTKLFFGVPLRDDVALYPDAWNLDPSVCNVGCGKKVSPFEVNVDLMDLPGVFRCDVRKLPDNWAGHFDRVKAHHILEHFEYANIENILQEWIRILKPGGILEIEVPDLQFCAEQILKGVSDPYLWSLIFGDQGNELWRQEPYGGMAGERYLPWSFENNSHKTGFTAKTLGVLLQKIGLKDIEGERIAPGIQIRGRKPNEDRAVGAGSGLEENAGDKPESGGTDSGDQRVGGLHVESDSVDPSGRTWYDYRGSGQPKRRTLPTDGGSDDSQNRTTELQPSNQSGEAGSG